jgi:uncharacterized protein (DUF2141 family)
MTMRLRAAAVLALVAVVPTWGQVAVSPPQAGRDTQTQAQAPATALIMGTVVTGSDGQPADGVRLTLSGAELRGSRSALSDDNGTFAFLALPPGTYTLRAVKTGYVSATFGQKSPGRPGTPIVLAVGQQLKDVSLEVPKGGVISGVIYDEKSRPAVSTTVRVLQWSMQSGERVLNSAGTATTDDRGMYRVFGLAPGEYVVNAVPRNTSTTIVTSEDLQNLARWEELSRTGLSSPADIERLTRDMAMPRTTNDPVSGYAAVYYPGTPQAGTAQSVKIGVSQELLGIDFQLQRVPLSRVTGQVTVPSNVTVTSVQVRLIDRTSPTPGQGQFSARPDRNGAFAIPSVPPGQYEVSATVTVPVVRQPVSSVPPADPAAAARMQMEAQMAGGGPRLWALAEVTVDGGYSPSVSLSLQPGMTVSGSVSFDGTAPLPQRLNQVRLTLSPHGRVMQSSGLSTLTASADANGRFTFAGVAPGQYRIRASSVAGWSLKSVVADGRDSLDFWVDVKPGENVSNVAATFGDKSTDLKGMLQSQTGEPTADYTVIIFPSDNRYWVPLSRRVRSARPSTDGRFSFMGLPAGEYRLAAVTDVESGAWYDPALLQQLQQASVSVRLIDGQPVIQNLRVSGS